MVHVVDRQEVRADRLLGGQVVDVGAGHAEAAVDRFGPACRTGAAVFDGAEVFGVA